MSIAPKGRFALAAALVFAAGALAPAAAHADETLFRERCARCHEPPTRLKGQTAAEKASLLDAFLKTHYADRTGTSDAQARAKMVTYLVGLAEKQKKSARSAGPTNCSPAAPETRGSDVGRYRRPDSSNIRR